MEKRIFLVLLHATLISASVNVWPEPASYTTGPGTAIIDESFTFSPVADSSNSPILNKAISRYQAIIFDNNVKKLQPHRMSIYPEVDPVHTVTKPTTSVTKLNIVIQESFKTFTVGSDESYSLDIDTSDIITLDARTLWGALRGLETFAQLVEWEPSLNSWIVARAAVPLRINDKPRFTWRGLLIDTSRHYIPVSDLLRQMDAMEANKLNVLHWHIVDSDSFPMVVPELPLLSQKGSYGPVYDVPAIQSVIQYGKERGIRVVLEVDTPGHSGSWGRGYPDLTAPCWNWLLNTYTGKPVYEALSLNPILETTYEAVDTVMGLMASVNPDEEYLHMGGDEVMTGCWESVPDIVNYMAARNWTSTDLWSYFEGRVQQLAHGHGKKLILWQEPFNNNFPIDNDAIANVWKDEATLHSVLEDGFDAVMSFGWYLDRQVPTGATHYLWIWTWHDFYQQEPYSGLHGLNDTALSHLLGGEASSWSESVSPENIDERIWSRGPAVAERLWSPANVTDIDNAEHRLALLHCRIARRGVIAGPVRSDYCATLPPRGSSVAPWLPATPTAPHNGYITAFWVTLIVLVVENLGIVAIVWNRRRRSAYNRPFMDEVFKTYSS